MLHFAEQVLLACGVPAPRGRCQMKFPQLISSRPLAGKRAVAQSVIVFHDDVNTFFAWFRQEMTGVFLVHSTFLLKPQRGPCAGHCGRTPSYPRKERNA